MGYLDTAGKFETDIRRGVLSSRSKRLDALVAAINLFAKTPGRGNLEDVEKKFNEWKRQDPKEFADRGKNTETQLRYEIAHKGVAYWGLGWPRVVDPASHPTYQPGVWNDNSVIQFSTNCYAYACNDPYNHRALQKPQPGQFAGSAVQEADEGKVRFAVMRDDQARNARALGRLIPLIRLRDDPVPDNVVNIPGYYLIALVTAPGHDYHWVRQDADGKWSHKPGWSEATDRDSNGKLIFDPREAAFRVAVGVNRSTNTYIYADYEFSTFYYAPKGGVRTGDLGTQRLLARRASF